ncbi:MAG: winged helix-turn-helix transcriptional regulator [Candidatus Pacebacteria bacterium]|nr:winged helix-turn-helix transcriptional regulator [Candidatus Paceibacterota bacterium]
MNTTKTKILKYIEKNDRTSVNKLSEIFSIGKVMIHRHLNNLLKNGDLVKIGTPPKVYYSIDRKSDIEKVDYNINPEVIKIINDNFTLLEPDGVEIEGFDGFVKWCTDRNFKVEDRADEYVKLIKEYDEFKRGNFIDATQKLTTTFNKENQFLDELYYMYPYSFPVYGKTKMGQWLFHAKQTQNKNLMKKVINIVIPQIENLIKEKGVNAVSFVPPTVPRNIQFMSELRNHLNINLPIIKIEKIKTEIMIQQKSLKDIGDRIKNAEGTMIINSENTNYEKLLLIDDFTGSGSTLNILAKKIKKQKIAGVVIGLTITGSMNGFEVIKEV